jgi:hypothetical protein
MTSVWSRLMVILSLAGATTVAAAQDAPEYRMEVGGGVGLLSYQGDFNGSVLKNQQGAVALTARYKLNPRMAWNAALTYSKLKGDAKDSGTWYPAEQPPLAWTFSNPLMDLSVRYEYNFWAFGTGREYYGARRVAPFLTMGLGLTYADAKPGAFALNVPMGAGVKVKVAERLNLTAEWVMHFTGSDKLDGVSDPYGIKSSGLFKNTDCYSALTVALTYDIWEKCKTCNNDR